MISPSFVLPFTLENAPVRGKFIRLAGMKDLSPSLAQATPVAQAALLDMLVGAALLHADFKQETDVTLQIQDPETHAVLAVHAAASGAIKAYANEVAQTQAFTNYQKHGALFALSSEQNGEAYQSLIPLEGDTVRAALVGYFEQSVQAVTQLRLWQAGDAVVGIFLQALPEEGSVFGEEMALHEKHKDDWARFNMVLDTLTETEIFDAAVETETLLFKLFHEDGVRVYDAIELSFTPANPREKMLQALLYVGLESCEEMLTDGPIVMRDDFSGLEETFTAEDIATLFAPLQKPN